MKFTKLSSFHHLDGVCVCSLRSFISSLYLLALCSNESHFKIENASAGHKISDTCSVRLFRQRNIATTALHLVYGALSY